jgi:hypothetical protein
VDYAPAAVAAETFICPAAGGVVYDQADAGSFTGMYLLVVHGLGWKTLYAHLSARYVSVGDRVERCGVMAIMGRSGKGATRPGVMATHLHLTLFGPRCAARYQDVAVQVLNVPPAPVLKYALDPEEFSLAGKSTPLPYPREEDARHDVAFLATHLSAVAECDALLRSLGDREAEMVWLRDASETAAGFDDKVDDRLWYLWRRLETNAHPFGPRQAAAYQARLAGFMLTVPRLTAPIVQPGREHEYRLLRPRPLQRVKEDGLSPDWSVAGPNAARCPNHPR